MKKNLVTAFVIGWVFLGLNAKGMATTGPEQFHELGFHSAEEMAGYFTVHSVEVTEVKTELTPELREQLSDLYQLIIPVIIPVTINPSFPSSPVTIPPVTGNPGSIPGTIPGTIAGTVPGSVQRPTLPQVPGTIAPTVPQVPIKPGTAAIPGEIALPGGIIIDPSGITAWITVGEKIWQIIAANRPVANVSSQRVAVLPVEQQDWAQMEWWKGPALSTYKITAKNLFGTQVFSETYTVAFNYGGSYNGKGSYLANVTIIPQKIVVVWGYTLDSSVEVGQTVNVGTKDNPVPGLSMDLKYSISNVFKSMDGHDAFFVKGNGETVHLAPTN